MLNERAKNLLKTLVERYIVEGQPVGSRSLSKYSGLELSPASIRNIMADLEDMGLIISPHTSAGRIPTPKGYRLFVDTLLTIKPLEQQELQGLKRQLLPDDPQRLVASASQLLSELTRFAGVVTTPRRQAAFKHVEFLKITEKKVLVIIVSTDGDVQNRIILTDRKFSASQLTQAANYLNQSCAGHDFDTVRERIGSELRELHNDISTLMAAVMEAGGDGNKSKSAEFILAGEHKLLNIQDLSSNMASLRKLFAIFEERTILKQLLEFSGKADGVKIFIGGESELSSLDEVSVVSSPYEVNGQVVGTVAVIGPTRMAYERVIPIVDVTAKLLSNALSY